MREANGWIFQITGDHRHLTVRYRGWEFALINWYDSVWSVHDPKEQCVIFEGTFEQSVDYVREAIDSRMR